MTAYAEKHALTIAVMGCRVNGPGETDMMLAYAQTAKDNLTQAQLKTLRQLVKEELQDE